MIGYFLYPPLACKQSKVKYIIFLQNSGRKKEILFYSIWKK